MEIKTENRKRRLGKGNETNQNILYKISTKWLQIIHKLLKMLPQNKYYRTLLLQILVKRSHNPHLQISIKQQKMQTKTTKSVLCILLKSLLSSFQRHFRSNPSRIAVN